LNYKKKKKKKKENETGGKTTQINKYDISQDIPADIKVK